MTRPIFYAFISIWLYAAQNVVIEMRLAKYTTMSLMLYWYVTMAPLALAGLLYMRIKGQAVAMPSGTDAILAVMVGVMFFLADMFYIGAYTNGGSLLAVTTLVVLFPAAAQLIKFILAGSRPNYYHLAGYILAALAVILISKGSIKVPQ